MPERCGTRDHPAIPRLFLFLLPDVLTDSSDKHVRTSEIAEHEQHRLYLSLLFPSFPVLNIIKVHHPV